MSKYGSCGCKLIVGHPYHTHVADFPLSANGWASAKVKATQLAKRSGLSRVYLECGDRRMTLYHCTDDARCTIERISDTFASLSPTEQGKIHTPLAGSRRRRR